MRRNAPWLLVALAAFAVCGAPQDQGAREGQTIQSITAALDAGRTNIPLSDIRGLYGTPGSTNVVPSPEAARLLCRLYKSPDKEISDLGGYLTVCQPYRKETKEVFFGLLRQRKYVREVAEACKEFEWRDAQPLFAEILDKPKFFLMYCQAYDAVRSLGGHPCDTNVQRMAEMVVRRGFGLQADSNAIAHAEGEIVSSQDEEFAALTGISLALFDAKASNEGIDFVRKVGLRILHALPPKMVDQTLNHLVESIEEPRSRDKVLDVRSRLLIMKGSNLPSDRTR